MVNDGKFLWADIPADFPDISVLNYTKKQLDDMKHISLVDAITEARRRLRVKKKNDARRADMQQFTKEMPSRIEAMNEAPEPPPPSTDISSVTVTGASSHPSATSSPTATPSTDHSPSTDTPQDEHKKVRRRVENDASISVDLSNRFDQAPLFLGKTPVKDIADILPANNLSTHMSNRLKNQRTVFLRLID